MARITFKGKTHSPGYYDSVDEAAAVRRKAEDEIFGEFLRQREVKEAGQGRLVQGLWRYQKAKGF